MQYIHITFFDGRNIMIDINISKVCKSFGFDLVLNNIDITVQKGKKVRLKTFCLIQNSYNFLILDEPTNHIDIDTREMLEESLKEFTGTILFVSHDRYFINKIATSIIEIKNKNITRYIGNYDDYREKINKI